MQADIKEIVKQLRAVDKDVIIVWVGYYNMANTGMTGPAGDFKLTLTEGVAVPEVRGRRRRPHGRGQVGRHRGPRRLQQAQVHVEGTAHHHREAEGEVRRLQPAQGRDAGADQEGRGDAAQAVLERRQRAHQPPARVDHEGARARRETHTYFISPNRQDALFSNHEMLQPIFPAEVMADKKAGRKDRPPGWPHPNEKGAGAIADIIIGLEDKDETERLRPGGDAARPVEGRLRPGAGTRGRARRPRRGCAPAPRRPRGAAAWTPSSIQRATSAMWSGVRPRVVIAGVPSRMPDGSSGGRGSNGTAL